MLPRIASSVRFWVRRLFTRSIRETSTIMGVNYPVQYTYDDVGNVLSLKHPDDTVLGYTYDDQNRIKTVGGYANLTYDRADRIEQVGYGNGVTGSYTYDTRGRPIQIRFTKGATLLNLTYAYDYSGSVTGIGGSVTESYGYDGLDRITSSNGAWGSISYTYDAAGNMLSKGATSYTYDNNMNRLSRVGASDDYSYDPNGNLVSRESGSTAWTYGYDSFNQLTSVRRNGTVQRLYSYDAYGRRVRSYGGSSGNVRYVYSGLKVLYEAPDAGGSPRLRFYAGSLQVAEKTGGTVEYLHGDHLGSTRLKTNSTGGVIYSSNYQPYGVSQSESGSEEYRYTGKPEDDASGLYYYGARYYDPNIGRFITADTILGSLSDPQSLNRYVYCRDNPIKYTDPDGRIAFPILLGIMTGVGALMGAATYWSNNPGDWEGAAKAAAVGASAGFVSGLTIGALAVCLTAGSVAGASITTAVESLGPLQTIAVSGIGGVYGGIAGKAVETEEYKAGLIQQAPDPVSPASIVTDFALSTAGAVVSTGVTRAFGVLGHSDDEIIVVVGSEIASYIPSLSASSNSITQMNYSPSAYDLYEESRLHH